MKKVLLVLALAIAGHFAIAQNVQVQNAFNDQKAAQQYIDQADVYKSQKKDEKAAKQMQNAKLMIQKAKTAIDAASVHEATMNQPKTWHYYAVIYYKIGAYPEFVDIDMNAYEKVLDAFVKIKNIDNDYFMRNVGEFRQYASSIGASYYDLGANSYNEGDYENAYINFKKAYDAMAVLGGKDNSALLNAALCAVKIDKYDEAVEMFQTLLDNGMDEPKVYQSLAAAYRGAGNNDKMLETIMVAREKFPEDEDVMNEMINTYLTLHREDEIIDQILEMAEKNTDQPVYYFILGTIYGNRESKLYNVDTALQYYDKAIAENASYADAYYNAGALLIDKASEIYDEANKKDPSEYANFNKYLEATDAMSAEAKSYDERAMPYVEKTYELLPDDPAVKQALKGIYSRLNMKDKAAGLE
jgi:tetratricopeptide (TPR) repeat protein